MSIGGSVRLDSLPTAKHSSTSASSWVTLFAGSRDAYQVPIALHEAGLLKMLVTDFYCPLDQAFTQNAVRLLPSFIQSKLRRRFSAGLPSRLVETHPLYVARTWQHPRNWTQNVGMLGEAAGRIAAAHRCGLLAYSHVATSAFVRAPEVLKVLFQMQPHPASVQKALSSDGLLPQFEDDVFDERTWPSQILATYAREPLLADLCIGASNYTRQTLIENGVPADRIAVVPYGVDLQFFTPTEETQKKFTVVFVGQIVRQKGLHYLLEAWRRLKLSNSELRIIGNLPSRQKWTTKYAIDAKFLGALDKNALRTEYRRADLLCFPSLSDGFGLVVLEAMACGTPVITTG